MCVRVLFGGKALARRVRVYEWDVIPIRSQTEGLTSLSLLPFRFGGFTW